MNGIQCFCFADGWWLTELVSTRTLGALLWAGFGVLTLSLIFLSRTRWGQAKPLSKCVVLSVFAHLLLFGYAYGTRLILDVPPAADREVIKLTLVEPGDSTNAQDATSPQEIPAWEQFPEQDVPEPDLTGLHRVQTDLTAAMPKKRNTNVPQLGAGPLTDHVPTPDIVRPTARTTKSTTRVARSTVQPLEIQQLNAERPQQQPSIRPAPAPLSRIHVSPPTIVTPERPANQPLNKTLPDNQSHVQRLADLPFATPDSDALASVHDLTRAAMNRTDVLRNATAPAPLIKQPVKSASSHTSSSDTAGSRQPAVPRPGDGKQLPELYHNRMAKDRVQIATRNGGSSRSESAVKLALRWLADHQEPDGRWDCDRHGGGLENNVLGQNRRNAGNQADNAVTGLALLALMGSGHSHLEGTYRVNVQRGLEFLLRSQYADGNLAGNARASRFAMMYCHGMASLALSEAYAITGDDRLKPYVQRAVAFSTKAQNPSLGGWRYQIGDVDADMSQFGWQVMALKSAQLGGIEVPPQTTDGMYRFLRSCVRGDAGGLASYRPGEGESRTMTAEALVCRFFLGSGNDPAAIQEACRFIVKELPGSEKPNLYFWYYATLGLYQANNEHWDVWNARLKEQLINTQETTGDLTGSWQPDTIWGGYGGRVYATAMATLCLEVYYRYLPVLHR